MTSNILVIECSDNKSVIIDTDKFQRKVSRRDVDIPTVFKRMLNLDTDFKIHFENNEHGMKVQTFAKYYNITSDTIGKFIGFLQSGNLNERYIVNLKNEIDKIGGSDELDELFRNFDIKNKTKIVPIKPEQDFNDMYEWVIGRPSEIEFIRMGFSVTVRAEKNLPLYYYRRRRKI